MLDTGSAPERSLVAAVDIGGTFTDCVLVDDDGKVSYGKSLSSPSDAYPSSHERTSSGTSGRSSMNVSAAARSYMNHEKPESSKSMTWMSSPSISRFASRMSAWTSPKRSGPVPYAARRDSSTSLSRPSSARSASPTPMPSSHRPQCGAPPIIVV